MKFLNAIACLLLSTFTALAVPPSILNVRLAWDAPGDQQAAYRLYEIFGTNRVFVLGTTNLSAVLSNVNVLAQHRWVVTATNIMGVESDPYPVLLVPTVATQPTNLHEESEDVVIQAEDFTLEGSLDLVNWKERIRITHPSNGVSVVSLTAMGDWPMYFWRAYQPPGWAKMPPVPLRNP